MLYFPNAAVITSRHGREIYSACIQKRQNLVIIQPATLGTVSKQSTMTFLKSFYWFFMSFKIIYPSPTHPPTPSKPSFVLATSPQIKRHKQTNKILLWKLYCISVCPTVHPSTQPLEINWKSQRFIYKPN